MKQAELVAYIVQLRGKLDDGSYTPEDAYTKIWSTESHLSNEQKQEVHFALELPYEIPEPFDFVIPESLTKD